MSDKSSVLSTALRMAIMFLCLASGCNSLRDAWGTRGVPPQTEPDISETAGEF